MKREAAFAPTSAEGGLLCAVRGAIGAAGWFSSRWWVVLLLGAVAAATVRAQWVAQDIGSVAAAGSTTASGSNSITIAGSGSDIQGTADSFHFYAQQFTSNITITARITGMTDTDGWAKAGVMIRESLAPNSANVFLAATPTWHGITAQQRLTTGGSTNVVDGPAVNAPYWLRLVRSGSSITAATSPDGNTWSTVTTFTTTFGAAPYYGLAVTSHNDGVRCTATFDNFVVRTEAPPTPAPPTNLTATAVSWNQIALSWQAGDTLVTNYWLERSTDGVNFTFVSAPPGNTTTYTDGGLAPSTTYYYRVRADTSSGPRSAYSNIASATTHPLPSSQSADIGTATPGQTSVNGDTITLTGSGRDIWNTADGFRYYYQEKPPGDTEMIVRVASLQNTHGWAKAGIMLRETLDPGSAHAWVCVSAAHGTAFQFRLSANAETQTRPPSEDGTAPRWLKLVFREQHDSFGEPRRVDGYVSHDGLTWTDAGGLYLNNTWRYIGLAVTSHNDGVLCTAQFDNLRLITPGPAPANFRVAHRGPNDEVQLAWDYGTADVDRFVIRSNPQRAGNHDWTVQATVPGTARQATIRLGYPDEVQVDITAHRDFVRSPSTWIWARSTVTPALSVTGTTSSSISLRITVTRTGISSPEGGPWSIERSSDGVNFVEIVRDLIGVQVDYTDSGLPSGVTRHYRARQLTASGDTSAYSPIVSATTTLGGSSPAAPTNLQISAITANQVGFTWTDNATNETSYQVERSTDGTTFSLLATLGANSAQYTDNTVAPSRLYYYRVRAVNEAGASPYSNVAGANTPATSPAAPTGLSATAISTSEIRLTWIDNTSDEYTFEVQRSTDGVNFGTTLPGTGPNATSLTDTGLNPSTTYHYRVRALTGDGGPSPYSNIAQATTPATNSPPPGTWQSADVGAVAMAGSDSTSGTTITVTGGGADIWHEADSFRFRYQTLNGDGSITARVTSMTNTDGWAKAGVMIRNSLAAGARNVLAALTPTWHGITAQARTTDGGATTRTAGPAVNAPYWVRLTRAGSTFTAQASPDGGTWATIATFTITMEPSVVIGLAVTSHNQNALCTATFDNVTIATTSTPPPPPPPPPPGTWSAADIGTVGIAGSHTASGSTITINGSGADIWSTADAFHFVWQTRTGDGVVEAQVASMGNTNGWAKAGVMIRESASANAPNVFVALTPSWHGIVAQARSVAGGETTVSAGPGNNAPYWVRLARTGNTFTASTSPDGMTWTPFATFNVAMSATANFGFAVTSHDNAQLNQAVFQDPFVGVR